MKTLFKRLAVSAATVGVLTSGMAMAGTSEAMAEATVAARAAAPCGLWSDTGDVLFTQGNMKIIYYTIRNCHQHAVKRKVDVAGDTDPGCINIPAGQTARSKHIVIGSAVVRGMIRCK